MRPYVGRQLFCKMLYRIIPSSWSGLKIGDLGIEADGVRPTHACNLRRRADTVRLYYAYCLCCERLFPHSIPCLPRSCSGEKLGW